jgi:hypothetical protein
MIVLGSGISSVIQLGFPLPRLRVLADIDPVTNATTPFPSAARASVPDLAKISGVAPMTLVTEQDRPSAQPAASENVELSLPCRQAKRVYGFSLLC